MESALQKLPTNIYIEKQTFPISYRHSSKAKRLSLRVSADRTRLTITFPSKWTHQDLERFINQSTTWLERKLKQWGPIDNILIPFEHESMLPILGEMRQIQIDPTNSLAQIVLKNDALVVPKKLSHPRTIESFLKDILCSYVCKKSRLYAEKLGVQIKFIRIKNLKSSYGICSSERNISYASRLVFAPIEVVDYVCAHEVSHLKEMNHSPSFWKTVQSIMPEYKTHKKWIKSHGHTLIQYSSF